MSPLKFVVAIGESFRSELSGIPWTNAFLASTILVAGIDDTSDVRAVCGIRSMLNVLTLYVREGFRGRGIGSQILEKTICIARERHLSFILLGVPYSYVHAFRLFSRFGFKEVVYLKKVGLRVMMLSLDSAGKIAYVFLCRITSLLPNTFWTYTTQWVHDRTVSNGEATDFG